MTRFVSKGRASGSLFAPTSKSVAHRLLITAATCEGESSLISGITPSEDVLATIDCLRALGVKIEYDGERAKVVGINFAKAKPTAELNCRESGSTLRFLIPLAMLSGNEVKFVGSERLMARSQSIYEKIARDEGILFRREADGITVRGPLIAKEYFIDGNVSSQFISGLLMALSTLPGDSRIIINTELESEPYVNMTIAALADFGVRVYREDRYSFFTFGGQTHRGRELQVEGDWSGAAFLEALNHIGGSVVIEGMNESSLQGDRVCGELFSRLDGGYAEMDIANCPDLAPILFTLAAIKSGARFTGTRRLRDKESDRIVAMQTELEKFGAKLVVEENAVTVLSRELHAPSERLHGHNDHRIVMSLSVICTLFGGEIDGCEAVSKSYPTFFKDIKALGIDTYEID